MGTNPGRTLNTTLPVWNIACRVTQIEINVEPADPITALNRYGHLPFIDGDPARPNPRYFEHVDWVVERAAQHGLRIATDCFEWIVRNQPHWAPISIIAALGAIRFIRESKAPGNTSYDVPGAVTAPRRVMTTFSTALVVVGMPELSRKVSVSPSRR